MLYIYLYGTCNESQIQSISKAFYTAWAAVVNNCRLYIEQACPQEFDGIPPQYHWGGEWQQWTNHTWELFIICGAENQTLEEVRSKMADRKQSRDWIGINWRGESSTISGTDTVAYPQMAMFNPKRGMKEADRDIRDFYQALSRDSEKYAQAPENTSPTKKTPTNAIEARERLSIPDLIKRLITYDAVRRQLHHQYPDQLPATEHVNKFTDLQRKENNRWTGWFQGDGDRMGEYISSLIKAQPELEKNKKLQEFSEDMLNWGEALQNVANTTLKNGLQSRIVYAGGDDFFGVLYRDDNDLTPQACLEQWWYRFNNTWANCKHKITVSTGFVWAAPNVPQRDLLQHFRQTEKAAKTAGRDRLAIRILFNSGNHLDWSCPWRYLKELLKSYHDRSGGNK